ncbi:MAG: glycosyltransferase family 2 protein [Lachnospiraceae bacterium]|nr:glycosyltransferase family 2 protein [Lachnospiraceae bacterium]
MENIKQETISIIIPVYNKAPHLPQCLDSVLSQTYPLLEVLLVDDGSTDDSLRICREYAEKDSRVRVLTKENGGASSARNMGIEEATGEYVGFVDADDWIEPGMYEKLLDYLRENKAYSCVQLMSRFFSADGELVEPARRADGETEVLTEEAFFRQLIMHEGDSSFCSKLFRSEFIKNYRFTEGRKNEDFELLLRMIPSLKAGIPTLGIVGYNIRLSEESATRGTYRQKLYEDMMYNAFTACRIARDDFPEYWEEGRRFRLVQALDFLLHIPIKEMKQDNRFYMRIMRFVRSEKKEIWKNRYLTGKQRRYLMLLATAPVKVRKVHRLTMKLRKIDVE